MNSHKRGNRDGLPGWATTTVVLGLFALFCYNVVVVGPDGYPTSVIIGGLLGAYAGVNELLKRRADDDDPPPPPTQGPPT